MKSPKCYYMKFDVGKWLKDPLVSACSPATRGIWMDLICNMHEADQCGRLSDTKDVLARFGRCSVAELDAALAEVKARKTADVTFRNAIVTVTNRKMRREYELREAARLRQRKHRGQKPRNANVTNTPESESESDSGINSQSPKSNPPARGSGSGRLKKPREGDLSEDVLRDESAFRRWVDRERRLPHGLVKSDDSEALAWAAREKALTDSTLEKPIGWLKTTLRGGKWDRVRVSHEDAGQTASREAAPAAEQVLAAAGLTPVLRSIPEDSSVADRRREQLQQCEALRKLEQEQAAS